LDLGVFYFKLEKILFFSLSTLFNLSLLAVRRYSMFYTSKEREKVIEQLPERLQTIRLD
jgi:hypothetical protein